MARLIKAGMRVKLFAMWDSPFLSKMDWMKKLDEWIHHTAHEVRIDPEDLRKAIQQIGPRERPAQVAAVINSCDAGVYPYRAEGWNLPLLETLACGLPVVATAYSGPVEYLSESNASLLKKYHLVEARDGVWFGPGKNEGLWAEPDLDELVGAMAEMYKKWELGKLEPNRAGVDTAEEFTWEQAARRVRNWLASGCEPSS
jgi:glycosyltransferase involved in cell wall biosynthesis